MWKDCRLVVPQNDPEKDIRAKTEFQPDLFLVAVSNSHVVGSVMAGYDGHRGWINYLAVCPELQKKGIGRRLMLEAENRLKALGCMKINLQIRESNTGVIQFYRCVGFSNDHVVSFGKRLV